MHDLKQATSSPDLALFLCTFQALKNRVHLRAPSQIYQYFDKSTLLLLHDFNNDLNKQTSYMEFLRSCEIVRNNSTFFMSQSPRESKIFSFFFSKTIKS